MTPPAKRRKTDSTTAEELTFDPADRQDYLTGFHKRKLQRAKHGREIAEKKARAERIEQRRKLREERRQDLERHVAEINALLKPVDASSEAASSANEPDTEQEWDGIMEPPEIDHEAEYIDEDRYTTVIVEAMDLSRKGLHKVEEAEEHSDRSKDGKADAVKCSLEQRQGKRKWTKEKPRKDSQASKRKRKKFRYENKTERKMTRLKEKSKNSRQAKVRRSD
ncbi:hypothetical protein GJ744_004484 [Endocarpon pusillum]|uniref:Protein required for cell viability Rrp17 n=1 Tax=Endocarpon pusillum TaxID=364733 RepID=A0A8H7AV94_9EURO|nr:hypothetical protein GJ744_004484 [Endocarpon pusillum]